MGFRYTIYLLFSYDVFFFLSGLLCRHNLNRASLKKDLRFILLPYCVYGVLIIVFSLLRSRVLDVNVLSSQVKSLLIGDDASIGPIWFLPALFLCKQMFLLLKKIKSYSGCLYTLLFILSLFPAFFISKFHLNLPFFADSALFGFPFFIIGNDCSALLRSSLMLKRYVCVLFSVVLGGVSIVLCKYNGFVDLASCTIGKSCYVYYIVAFTAIFSIIFICQLLNKVHSDFILITSYGTIATLGLHGIPLSLLDYYVPLLFGYESYAYSILGGIFFSIITYCICYLIISYLDKRCPLPFGLKGLLNKK